MEGQFLQSTPNQLSEKEIKMYRKQDQLTECVKCKGVAISTAGTVYCNDCGIVENVFFRVDISRKPRNLRKL